MFPDNPKDFLLTAVHKLPVLIICKTIDAGTEIAGGPAEARDGGESGGSLGVLPRNIRIK